MKKRFKIFLFFFLCISCLLGVSVQTLNATPVTWYIDKQLTGEGIKQIDNPAYYYGAVILDNVDDYNLSLTVELSPFLGPDAHVKSIGLNLNYVQDGIRKFTDSDVFTFFKSPGEEFPILHDENNVKMGGLKYTYDLLLPGSGDIKSEETVNNVYTATIHAKNEFGDIPLSPLDFLAGPEGTDVLCAVALHIGGVEGVMLDGEPISAWAGDLARFTVPEPATMILFGSGLVGLTGLTRRFRKNRTRHQG